MITNIFRASKSPKMLTLRSKNRSSQNSKTQNGTTETNSRIPRHRGEMRRLTTSQNGQSKRIYKNLKDKLRLNNNKKQRGENKKVKKYFRDQLLSTDRFDSKIINVKK